MIYSNYIRFVCSHDLIMWCGVVVDCWSGDTEDSGSSPGKRLFDKIISILCDSSVSSVNLTTKLRKASRKLMIFMLHFSGGERGRMDDLSFFEYLSPFCFLSIEFYCTFFISCKILQHFVYYYCILVRM